jgi:hypothetical protein
LDKKRFLEGEKMKNISVGVVILITLGLSSYAFADYLIRFKNGRTIKTPKYWEEKGEVKFQWEGGIASIHNGSVLTIRQVEEKFPKKALKEEKKDSTEQPQQPSLEAPKEAPQPGMSKVEPADQVEKAASSEILRESDVEYYKKQKAHYMEQYEQALQRYHEASSRKDVEGKKKAWEEFNRFGGQVITLETELKKKNNGTVPSWWNE